MSMMLMIMQDDTEPKLDDAVDNYDDSVKKIRKGTLYAFKMMTIVGANWESNNFLCFCNSFFLGRR